MVGFFNSGVFSAAVSLPGEMFIWVLNTERLLCLRLQVHQRDSVAFHSFVTLGEILGPITFGLLYFLVGSSSIKWFLGTIFVAGEIMTMLILLYASLSPLSKYIRHMKEPGATFDLQDHPNAGYTPINVDLY